MRRLRSGILARAVLILACAGIAQAARADEFRKANLPEHGRIGIAAVLEPEFTNQHIGITVFTNVDERLPNDWGLDRTAVDAARKLLQAEGYEVVDLALDGETTAAIRKADDWSRLNYSGLGRDWMSRYAALLATNRLDAVVVMREQIVSSLNGRFSHHGYGLSSAQASALFTSVIADVISGNPPHRSVGECNAVRLFESDPVESQRDLKMTDIAWMREPLETLIRQKVAVDLYSAGVLHEQYYCPGISRQKLRKPEVAK